jgi:hypothetical protein
MRITLNADEVTKLLNIIQSIDTELYGAIYNQYKADTSKDKSKKRQSIQEATKKREQTAKAKIINAINILKIESREITAYAIAKESGCSYNTVKKYYDDILKEAQNEH